MILTTLALLVGCAVHTDTADTAKSCASFLWYPDADGDGWGVDADPIASSECDAVPLGYVQVVGDCDDADATVHPGADELCDGLDQDCDGEADDGATVQTGYADVDGDGYGAGEPLTGCTLPAGAVTDGGDCDDADAAIHPGAVEACNGVDDDCDDTIDEDVQPTWYDDADGDGWGAGEPQVGCPVPETASTRDGDCDDGDAAVNPDAVEVCDGVDQDCDGAIDDGLGTTAWYADGDGDGFGDLALGLACTAPQADAVVVDGDCDDADATVNPDATEVCDGLDDDCDGAVDEDGGTTLWFADEDGDGSGGTALGASCSAPTETATTVAGDCDDTDSGVHPAAPEVCDGVDQDCDGDVDEGVLTTGYEDLDGDGYGGAEVSGCSLPADVLTVGGDCDDADPNLNPAAAEACNGLDEDCDGVADDGLPGVSWYDDGDADGYGAGALQTGCAAPARSAAVDGDCDDGNAAVNPGATETCDGIDEDCDGTPDDGLATSDWYDDHDGDGYGSGSFGPACGPPTADAVLDGTDCNDELPTIHPGAAETCDGVDEDCDGLVDEGTSAVEWYGDMDGDGWGDLDLGAACAAPEADAVTVAGDCDDTNPAVHPGAAETCNSVDDDCDGEVDEGVTSTWYEDVDDDGFGAGEGLDSCSTMKSRVLVDGDCDDADPAVNPDATETCNGVDDDCDGTADEGLGGTSGWGDEDGDGYGNPDLPGTGCLGDGFVDNADDCDDTDTTSYPGATELCGDLADNDCDGEVNEGCTVDHCGTISTDETWSAGYIHRVSCTVYVDGAGGPTLTIEDGAVVELYGDTSIVVGASSSGKLVADGSTWGITFTSAFDDPLPGDWGSLWFGPGDRGSVLRGVDVEYGGDSWYGMVVAWYNHTTPTRTLTLDGVTFGNSSTNGLYVSDTASVALTASNFYSNLGYGLYALSNTDLGGAGTTRLSGLTFYDNASPALIEPDQVPLADTDWTVTANDDDDVVVAGGSVTSSATWPDLGVPYEVVGRVLVDDASDPVLTLADGVEVHGGPSGYFEVATSAGGSMVVDGTGAGVHMSGEDGAAWPGIYLYVNSTGSTFTGLTLEDAGDPAYGGLVAYTPGTVVLTDTTISGGSGAGLWVNGPELTLTDVHLVDNAGYGLYSSTTYTELEAATGLEITGNTLAPLHLGADDLGQVGADALLTGNGDDEVELMAETITRSGTWSSWGLPLHVLGSCEVGGSGKPTLTIEDAVDVLFAPGSTFQIGDAFNDGALRVYGDGDGVRMTSDQASPLPGDWVGLLLYGGGGDVDVTGLDLGYAGRGGKGAIDLESSNVHTSVFVDTTVHDSASNGVYVYGGALWWEGGEIVDNAGDGIHTLTYSSDELLWLGGTTITGNTGAPVHTGFTSAEALQADNTLTGNGSDVVELTAGAAYSGDTTWVDPGVPYELQANLDFSSGDLTLGAGVTFLVDRGLYVRAVGAAGLIAEGTAEAPVVFTSAEASPAPGDWGGVVFWYDSGWSSLDHFEVSYAGSAWPGNLYVLASSPTLSNGLVAWSSTWGIYRDSASPTLTSLTYLSNASGDLY